MQKILINVLITAAFASICSTANSEVYKVAVSSGATNPTQAQFIEATKEYLTHQFGTHKLVFLTKKYQLGELKKLLKKKKIDYFISTAGFSRLLNESGSKELLTYTDNRFPDSMHALGSVLIVRRDSDINSISDLKSKTFIANGPEAFYSHVVAMGEIFDHGYDPESFFKRIVYLRKGPKNLLESLLNNEGDVIALPSCFLEDSFDKDSPERMLTRPINIRSAEPCVRSSLTYPNWSISATANSNPEFTRELVSALLQMPKSPNGGKWSILTDYSEVDNLFKKLKIGSYSHLRHFSFNRMLSEHSAAVAAFGLSLIFLLVGLVYLYLELRLRTKLLVSSLNEQIRVSEEVNKAQERFNALQKVGVIGQMSSMIAHELRQPVGAIQAYCEGLILSKTKGLLSDELLTETLTKILAQNSKVGTIIDRVRSYAKKGKIEKKALPILPVICSAIASFNASLPQKERKIIVLRNADQIVPICLIAPIELEIAIVNLLKNAYEAVKASVVNNPKIIVQIGTENSFCVIEVSDNGKEVSSSLFESISSPLASEKENGLGLGLQIVKSIAADHGGKLKFRKNPEGGLTVFLLLPIFSENT